MGTSLDHLSVVRDDLVDIDLPTPLYHRLLSFAAAAARQPGDIVDAVLCDAMEPPAPERTRATLDCGRCGFTKHRWARTVLIGGGEYAHLFGCVKCFKLRRYGTVAIRGCEQPGDAAEVEEDPAPAVVKAPPALWSVPLPPRPRLVRVDVHVVPRPQPAAHPGP